jgi:serine/threonine-protein kinase
MGEEDARFGSYRLIKRLGRGGMGETWHAVRDDGHGVSKDVVIKRILRSVSDNPSFVEAFVSEARLSARLNHGNLAQVYEFGEIDGEHFMALEFVSGQPLHRALSRAAKQGLKGLPPAFAIYVLMELLKGLHHAHHCLGADGKPLHIVHRDISPDNVLLSYEGEVKVVDFGIAKAEYAGRAETEPGVVKGKYQYFSPEQATADPLDLRSDIYSCGVLLHELLAGRPPLEGQAHVVLHKLLLGEFPRLTVAAPWVNQGLLEIVERATRAKKDDRYESALEFQQALGEQLHQLGPETSQLTVSGMMTFLFGPELSAMGRTVVVPRKVQELVDAHRRATSRFEKETISELQPAVSTPTAPTAPERPRSRGRPAWQWALIAGAVLLGFAATAFVIEERDTQPDWPAKVHKALERRDFATAHALAERCHEKLPCIQVDAMIASAENAAERASTQTVAQRAPVVVTREDSSAQIREALTRRGRDLITEGKLKEARTALNDCLDADPNAYDCMFLLGLDYENDGRNDDAEGWYRKFVERGPNTDPGHLHAQEFLAKRARAEEAAQPVVSNVTTSPLAHSEVTDVILAHQSQINRCLDEQHRREPDGSGTVQAHFEITADGKVTNLQMTPAGSYVSGCLATLTASLKFARNRATKNVIVPFRY